MRVFFSFYIGVRKHGQRTAAWEARIPGLGFGYLRGCAQGQATQAAYFLGFPPETPKMTTSGPNPGSRAQNLGLGQMRSFLVVLEGLTPNLATSVPNPWFWAQNHGFGPDVVIFSLTPPVPSHHKTHEKTQWLQPDTSKLVKQSPNDADDAGHAEPQ